MTTKNVTIGEFIQKYLIDQVKDIKDNHPYFAFLLMAVGIEFLGKCQNANAWDDIKHSGKDFKQGLNISPLKKYNKGILACIFNYGVD